MISRIQASVLLLLCSTVSTGYAQTASSQLEVIKSEVLKAAMADGVSVVSSAYVNGDGQLIESSFYQASGGIRGVRLQSLITSDNASEYAGYIETSPLNPSLSCDQLPAQRYSRAITVSSAVLQEVEHRARNHLRVIGKASALIESALSAEVITQPQWALLPVRALDLNENTPLYTQFTDGKFVDPRNSDIQLRVTITEFSDQLISPGRTLRSGGKNLKWLTTQVGSELGFGWDRSSLAVAQAGENRFKVKVSLVLVQTDSGAAKGEKEIAKANLAVRLTVRDGRIDNASQAGDRVALATSKLLEEAYKSVRCQPESLTVYRQEAFADATPTLNQGARVGIKRGDRFLLSTRKFTDAGQLVDSDMLESLAIAEVVRVHLDNAELQILEGEEKAGMHTSALPF